MNILIVEDDKQDAGLTWRKTANRQWRRLSVNTMILS